MINNIDIDILLFFKYLKGLDEEKSVKALSFKIDKHPSTIRRMIKKVEDLLKVSLVIYENYQSVITLNGYKLLETYDKLQENITLNDLYGLIETTDNNDYSVVISEDFLIPYVFNYIEKKKLNVIQWHLEKNPTINNDKVLFFSDTHQYPNEIPLHLYLCKYNDNINNIVVVHQYLYFYLDKLMDFSSFDDVIIVPSNYLLQKYIDNKYSIITYNFNNYDNSWQLIPLNLSWKIFTNHDD